MTNFNEIFGKMRSEDLKDIYEAMDYHKKVYFIAEQISTGKRSPLGYTIDTGYIPEDPHILDEYGGMRVIATYDKDIYEESDEMNHNVRHVIEDENGNILSFELEIEGIKGDLKPASVYKASVADVTYVTAAETEENDDLPDLGEAQMSRKPVSKVFYNNEGISLNVRDLRYFLSRFSGDAIIHLSGAYGSITNQIQEIEGNDEEVWIRTDLMSG